MTMIRGPRQIAPGQVSRDSANSRRRRDSPGPQMCAISRTRADFDRFSDVSEILETEMWSEMDLNLRLLLRLSIAKLPANLAAYSTLIKSSRAGEIIIATSSPHSFSLRPHRLI